MVAPDPIVRAKAQQPVYAPIVDDYGSVNAAPALKRRGKAAKQDGEHRSGFQTFICLIVGIAALSVLGFTAYTLLMGGLFTVPSGGVYPLPSADGAFGIIPNYEGYIEFYQNLYKVVSELITSSGAPVNEIVAAILSLVPMVLLVTSVPIAALMVCISAFVAVFRFIAGLCSGKFFSLAAHLGWALSGLLVILLATAFAGLSGYVTASSGLTICLILCTAAIALCVLGNLLFAGKRFFRAGSMMKFLTNGGILAGAIISALSLPLMFFTHEGVTDGNLGFTMLCSSIEANQFDMPFALYAVIAVCMLIAVFTLPAFVRKTSTRFAKTFKFDGYEDKGFLRKGLFNLIGLLLIAVPVFLIAYGNYYDTALVISQSVYVFVAGGVITFVSAILNRVFLNSDQR